MREFAYFAPQSLRAAIGLLQQRGDSGRPLAGGTDLVPQMKEGATRFPFPSCVVSLSRIPELHGIGATNPDGLRIGAGVTMAEIADSALIRERYPAIADGAAIVGSFQTMNVATIGGNLCNAAPSADTAPPLLAHETVAVIAGPSGQRTVPLDQFFLGPGLTVLRPGELLVELRVPSAPARTGSVYRRHTPRKQMDIAVVGVAAALTLREDGVIEKARVALGAVAPTPIRARETEAMLEGKSASPELFALAAESASAEAQPISDVRGSAEFRRHLVRVMTVRMLQLAAERATG